MTYALEPRSPGYLGLNAAQATSLPAGRGLSNFLRHTAANFAEVASATKPRKAKAARGETVSFRVLDSTLFYYSI